MLVVAVELVVVRGGIQLRRPELCVVSREDGWMESGQASKCLRRAAPAALQI